MSDENTPNSQPSATVEEEITYCERHPNRETSLRCNKCNRYMCTQCAVQTPVGYRCQQCIREHDSKFFNATFADYAIGFAVSAAVIFLSLVLIADISRSPLRLVALLAGYFSGRLIRYLTRRLTQNHRARYMHFVGLAGLAVGFGVGYLVLGPVVTNLIVIGFGALAAFMIYYQFRIANNV